MSGACLALPLRNRTAHSTNLSSLSIVPRIQATAEADAANTRKQPQSLRLVHPEAQPEPEVNSPRRSVRPFPKPHLAFYRKYTEAMLQRYMIMSLEAGRVPSLLGRELFKGDVSHCKVQAFDDVVIFVHDVGNMIERLPAGLRHLIRRIGMQGYTQAETAALTGIAFITVRRHYAEAIDLLTGMLIDANMLEALLAIGAEDRERSSLNLPLRFDSEPPVSQPREC